VTSWPFSLIAAAIYASPMGGMLIVDTKFVKDTNLEGSIRQTFISSLGKWNWLYLNHLSPQIIAYQAVISIYIGFLKEELKGNYVFWIYFCKKIFKGSLL
jgi:hypothetical protein